MMRWWGVLGSQWLHNWLIISRLVVTLNINKKHYICISYVICRNYAESKKQCRNKEQKGFFRL